MAETRKFPVFTRPEDENKIPETRPSGFFWCEERAIAKSVASELRCGARSIVESANNLGIDPSYDIVRYVLGELFGACR